MVDGASARSAGARADHRLTVALLGVAAVGWWWSIHMSGDMAGMMALPPFVLAWLAMMAAMMLPAVAPVVLLYHRTAAAARLAPLPLFLAGYLAVWTLAGLPAYAGWRAFIDDLMMGATWTAYLTGSVLIASATYQLTPLKSVCLKHCRTPMSFFLQHANRLRTPAGAVAAGAHHGLWCLGCCWALMASLVALGAMQPLLMAGVAAIVYVEKATRIGQRATAYIAAILAAGGVAFIVDPSLVMHLT